MTNLHNEWKELDKQFTELNSIWWDMVVEYERHVENEYSKEVTDFELKITNDISNKRKEVLDKMTRLKMLGLANGEEVEKW